MTDIDHACVSFRMGGAICGIPLAQVGEIAPAGRIVPVPMAPAIVKGLVNVRGRVLTLIDIAAIHGLALPAAQSPGDRLAVALAPPWANLALYVHAPVQIAQAGGVETALAAKGLTAAVGGSDPSGSQTGRVPERGITLILDAAEVAARCEAEVVDVFRRKS